MTQKLGKELKSQFPIFRNNVRVENNGRTRPLVYLDSAVSAQKPQVVIDAIKHHLEFDYGSVHRGAYHLSITSSEMYETVRKKCANFVGVPESQIIFTKGTTEGINILSNGFAREMLTENDRIIVPVSEHHANFVPWQQAALYKNCEIAYIPLVGTHGNDLKLNLAEAKKLITKNTKVITLASMGNVLGQINPVAEIVEMAKKVGAYIFVDAAQSASCLEVDYFAMGVDAVAFSGHKLYGPSGIGILAMSKELMEKLPPLLYGGGMISSVTLEESTWINGPAKFEAGTPPITEVAGLGAAIDWVLDIGRHNIHSHSSHLASIFIEELKKLPFIELFAPETGQETIVSFRHKTIHAHDLATILDSFHVSMRAGHHCAWPLIRTLGVDALLRCSFAAYSDEEDIAIALEGIKGTTNLF
ncbi:MAG: cysteine desulfurase [Bdellovibrionota bacterium]